MKIKRNQNYTLAKLHWLKYGDVFEYDEQIYAYMKPDLVKPECSDTVPVFDILNGRIGYLCRSTDVIHYPNAELCLGNAYKG